MSPMDRSREKWDDGIERRYDGRLWRVAIKLGVEEGLKIWRCDKDEAIKEATSSSLIEMLVVLDCVRMWAFMMSRNRKMAILFVISRSTTA